MKTLTIKIFFLLLFSSSLFAQDVWKDLEKKIVTLHENDSHIRNQRKKLHRLRQISLNSEDFDFSTNFDVLGWSRFS